MGLPGCGAHIPKCRHARLCAAITEHLPSAHTVQPMKQLGPFLSQQLGIEPWVASLIVIALAGGGETVEVTFRAPTAPGTYTFLCSFPGHFAAGMRGTLVIK